jgi:TIR domain-containing protein
MKPGTIFISHRAEYATLVRRLQKAIETTSGGQIKVVISEDLPGGEAWRPAIKAYLDDAESLFLVYGAPYEDWSWCFYEVGYFAGLGAAQTRRIYCIARPDVDAPGPLSDLQLVTDQKSLNLALMDIYKRNDVDYDPGELRQTTSEAAKGLFGKLEEFRSYPRLYFTANDTDFGTHADLPASAAFKGDTTLLTQLFGIGKKAVPWSEIIEAAGKDRSQQELDFFGKWAAETKQIILAARDNRVLEPQTVLVRGSQRVRFLLNVARKQGDGLFSCEFLILNEVGGPALGLPPQQLALMTSIRLGFRFRYEFIRRFAGNPASLSDDERLNYIRDIPRIINGMTTEAETRGNITLEDLQGAFEDEDEADRIGTVVGYWPMLKDNLYQSLGVAPDGKVISDQGLKGPNADRFRLAFDALKLVNIEFVSRCCARLAQRTIKNGEELKKNADALEAAVRRLSLSQVRPAA